MCGAGVLLRAAAGRRPKSGILVTLCRFDDKPGPEGYLGPFIPCERRLAQLRILEIQGRA